VTLFHTGVQRCQHACYSVEPPLKGLEGTGGLAKPAASCIDDRRCLPRRTAASLDPLAVDPVLFYLHRKKYLVPGCIRGAKPIGAGGGKGGGKGAIHIATLTHAGRP
jgi:hypothetical protein